MPPAWKSARRRHSSPGPAPAAVSPASSSPRDARAPARVACARAAPAPARRRARGTRMLLGARAAGAIQPHLATSKSRCSSDCCRATLCSRSNGCGGHGVAEHAALRIVRPSAPMDSLRGEVLAERIQLQHARRRSA
jgi:hypothetical protein